MKECKKEAEERLSRDVPEAKIASIVIIILWIFIIGVIEYKVLFAVFVH